MSAVRTRQAPPEQRIGVPHPGLLADERHLDRPGRIALHGQTFTGQRERWEYVMRTGGIVLVL